MAYTRGFNGKKNGKAGKSLHYHNDTGTGEEVAWMNSFVSAAGSGGNLVAVKKNTVYEMIKQGDLKATKMGKQFRIARKGMSMNRE